MHKLEWVIRDIWHEDLRVDLAKTIVVQQRQCHLGTQRIAFKVFIRL